MFGLDFGTIGGLLFILCGIVIIAVLVTAQYVKKHGSPEAKAEWARVRAGEFNRADDLYKQTPAYDAAKQFEESAKKFAVAFGDELEKALAKVKQEAQEARTAVRSAVDGPATPAPAAAIPAAEGIDAAAKRLGIDAAILRVLAMQHPGATWDQLAADWKNRAAGYTDADKDTVAAATGQV